MSAFEVARILPAIRQVLESPGDGWCATLEIPGVGNAWAQVTKGTLNLAYPFPGAPDMADVAAQLPGAVLESWEPGTYATFGFGDASADAIARTVDLLFTKYFKLREYAVESRVEDLDA